MLLLRIHEAEGDQEAAIHSSDVDDGGVDKWRSRQTRGESLHEKTLRNNSEGGSREPRDGAVNKVREEARPYHFAFGKVD